MFFLKYNRNDSVPFSFYILIGHIQVEVDHARSVLEIFDAISYEKGSSVIRMLQTYLGYKVFQV